MLTMRCVHSDSYMRHSLAHAPITLQLQVCNSRLTNNQGQVLSTRVSSSRTFFHQKMMCAFVLGVLSYFAFQEWPMLQSTSQGLGVVVKPRWMTWTSRGSCQGQVLAGLALARIATPTWSTRPSPRHVLSKAPTRADCIPDTDEKHEQTRAWPSVGRRPAKPLFKSRAKISGGHAGPGRRRLEAQRDRSRVPRPRMRAPTAA